MFPRGAGAVESGTCRGPASGCGSAAPAGDAWRRRRETRREAGSTAAARCRRCLGRDAPGLARVNARSPGLRPVLLSPFSTSHHRPPLPQHTAVAPACLSWASAPQPLKLSFPLSRRPAAAPPVESSHGPSRLNRRRCEEEEARAGRKEGVVPHSRGSAVAASSSRGSFAAPSLP